MLDRQREARTPDAQHGSLLGPRATDDDIRTFLDGAGAVYQEHPDDASFCDAVADLLTREQVVGWFQGRMEFGPRALGSRSILGDARSRDMRWTPSGTGVTRRCCGPSRRRPAVRC